MGNDTQHFEAKARASWANWLIAALITAGVGILLGLFGGFTFWPTAFVVIGFVCLIGAGVSALMRVKP